VLRPAAISASDKLAPYEILAPNRSIFQAMLAVAARDDGSLD
jgi:hypothetical protein